MKPVMFILAIAALAVAGCTKEQWERAQAPSSDYKYHSGTEIPEGPGAFSGPKGSWTLDPPSDLFGSSSEPQDPNEVRKVRRKD